MGSELVQADASTTEAPEKVTRPAEWLTMDSAPRNRHIIVLTEAGSVVRVHWTWIGDDASGWGAVTEDEHPRCWTDGFCWASNEDGEPSDPPVLWTYVPRLLSGPVTFSNDAVSDAVSLNQTTSLSDSN